MSGIVVGAFEPFGGRRRNRAWDAAQELAGRSPGGHPVTVARLPTVFAALPRAIGDLFAADPALVLLVGESAAARWLLVERIALNVAHARLADNAGARPTDEEVERGGELARHVTFDPRAAVSAALAAGVRADVSSHAGTFCCNAAFYLALGLARGLALGTAKKLRSDPPPVAFVHVPARFPWASDARAARGLCAIAEAIVRARPAAAADAAIGRHSH